MFACSLRAMKDHERAILEERINYYLAKRTERIVFAELDTGGKIIECPNCHVQFTPTLGKIYKEQISFVIDFFLFSRTIF